MDKFSYKITSNSSTRENTSNKNRYLNLVQELTFENISNEKLQRIETVVPIPRVLLLKSQS